MSSKRVNEHCRSCSFVLLRTLPPSADTMCVVVLPLLLMLMQPSPAPPSLRWRCNMAPGRTTVLARRFMNCAKPTARGDPPQAQLPQCAWSPGSGAQLSRGSVKVRAPLLFVVACGWGLERSGSGATSTAVMNRDKPYSEVLGALAVHTSTHAMVTRPHTQCLGVSLSMHNKFVRCVAAGPTCEDQPCAVLCCSARSSSHQLRRGS